MRRAGCSLHVNFKGASVACIMWLRRRRGCVRDRAREPDRGTSASPTGADCHIYICLELSPGIHNLRLALPTLNHSPYDLICLINPPNNTTIPRAASN